VRVVVGDAHPTFAGYVAANATGGVTDRDREVGKITGDDRAGADHDVLTDRRAAEDERTVAEP
jgi:hypothetical protein